MVSETTDRISELIRTVTDSFEDAFQDAWVKVIEKGTSSEDDILQIARESRRRIACQVIHERYRQISIEKPIGPHQDEDGFTFLDVLPSPEQRTDDQIDSDIAKAQPYQANSSGKYNREGHVHLDWETLIALRKLYPHDPIAHIIRKLAHLPPPNRLRIGWHKWEDAIVRTRYPWGGARAVALDVFRSLNAIEHRAHKLGVQAGKALNSYKPCKDWLNIPELADRLSCSYEKAARLIKNGQIESVRISKYHQGHDGVFVTPESLEKYQSGEQKRLIEEQALRQKKEAESLALKLVGRMLRRMANASSFRIIDQAIYCDFHPNHQCVLRKLQTKAVIQTFLRELAKKEEH